MAFTGARRGVFCLSRLGQWGRVDRGRERGRVGDFKSRRAASVRRHKRWGHRGERVGGVNGNTADAEDSRGACGGAHNAVGGEGGCIGRSPNGSRLNRRRLNVGLGVWSALHHS